MAKRVETRTHDERMSDIVDALTTCHPAPMTLQQVGAAVGCSAELVRWHAKRSARVVLRREFIGETAAQTTMVRLAPQAT